MPLFFYLHLIPPNQWENTYISLRLLEGDLAFRATAEELSLSVSPSLSLPGQPDNFYIRLCLLKQERFQTRVPLVLLGFVFFERDGCCVAKLGEE